MKEIKVPELGENIDAAEVLRVLVSKGDRVSAEQPVLELETDKAAIEMPVPEAGVIGEVLVSPGDVVAPGQAAIRLEEEGAEAKAEEPEPAKQPEPAESGAEEPEGPPPTPSPRRGEGRAGGEPETVSAEEPPREEPQPARRPEPAREIAPPRRPTARTGDGRPVPAGPATRRFAREVGVDLQEVAGRAGERVTREDVKAYLREEGHPAPAAERERMSRLRLTSAERLAAAWREVPHVTHHDRADVTDLEAARRALRGREDAPRLTMTALAARAVVAALRAHPKVNSSLDLERGELIYHGACHIGIAVDTEHGLLVPVVRDAGRKTTRELAEEITELAEKARGRKLTPDEMQGATFSITNLGGIGGVAFTPIVLPPQVAILGLSRSQRELVLRDGEPTERLFLPLSLSYDHRVVDGADAARFTRHLARLLESPIEFLLEC